MGPHKDNHGPQTPCSRCPRRIQMGRPSFGDRSRGPRGNDDASRLLNYDPHRLHLTHDQERRNQGTMFNLCQHHRRHHHQGRRSPAGNPQRRGQRKRMCRPRTRPRDYQQGQRGNCRSRPGCQARRSCDCTFREEYRLCSYRRILCEPRHPPSERIFDYKTQDSYIQKKNVCDSKTTAWNTATNAIAPAETKVTDAKSEAAAAELSASGLKVTCQCDAKKRNADAWEKSQTDHASHAADWKQANEILCTLNAQSTACNSLPLPAVTRPALAAGVADATSSTVIRDHLTTTHPDAQTHLTISIG